MAAPADETPSRFGDYVRGEELGRGASCRVYSCWHVAEEGGTKRIVDSRGATLRLAAKAVDLRRLRLVSSVALRKRKLLQRELEILEKVPSHPNVVRFIGTVLEGDWLFFVLERVDGGDLLSNLMKLSRSRGKKLPKLAEVEALHIFKQIVEGLGFLHENGVIHRDLKPENVLVAQTRTCNETGAALLDVKIADFGLSKFVGDGRSDAQSTVGSPRYMAPEVVASGSYDFSADLWSLGVLVFVLLDGQFPCDGMPQVPQTQLNAAVARLKVGAHARAVVAGLLQKRPDARLTIGQLREHPWLAGGAPADASAAAKAASARGRGRAPRAVAVDSGGGGSSASGAGPGTDNRGGARSHDKSGFQPGLSPADESSIDAMGDDIHKAMRSRGWANGSDPPPFNSWVASPARATSSSSRSTGATATAAAPEPRPPMRRRLNSLVARAKTTARAKPGATRRKSLAARAKEKPKADPKRRIRGKMPKPSAA